MAGSVNTVSITQDEILEALAVAAGSVANAPEEARTSQELADSTGLNVDRVRAALKMFQKQGRLTLHKVRRLSLDGRMAVVTAYTIRPV